VAKALVVYDSKTGNTEKMAKAIAEGMKESALDVEVKRVDDASPEDLVGADVIVLGSPTRFASMSSKMMAFIEGSTGLYRTGELRDKIGAAFTSSSTTTQGNQTTILSLVQAMLEHRMLIVGHQDGSFGVMAIKEPDDKCLMDCREFGKRIAGIAKSVRGN
jgi:NAD(P)H dehydrogenase (quinone)